MEAADDKAQSPTHLYILYLKLLLMEVVNIKRQEKASLIFLVSTRPIGASINYVEKLKDKRSLVIRGRGGSKLSILLTACLKRITENCQKSSQRSLWTSLSRSFKSHFKLSFAICSMHQGSQKKFPPRSESVFITTLLDNRAGGE